VDEVALGEPFAAALAGAGPLRREPAAGAQGSPFSVTLAALPLLGGLPARLDGEVAAVAAAHGASP
jgi:hypothetical protein